MFNLLTSVFLSLLKTTCWLNIAEEVVDDELQPGLDEVQVILIVFSPSSLTYKLFNLRENVIISVDSPACRMSYPN